MNVRRAILLTACLLCGPAHALTQEEIDAEKARRVKAAYLFNFAKYVEWPARGGDGSRVPIRFCVLGDSRFADAVRDTVRGKRVHGRKLTVDSRASYRQWRPADLEACHFLFVSEGAQGELPAIIRALKNSDVLLVGEGREFAREGGMIALVLEGDRIGFHVHRGAVSRSGASVSAKLLALATVVHGD